MDDRAAMNTTAPGVVNATATGARRWPGAAPRPELDGARRIAY